MKAISKMKLAALALILGAAMPNLWAQQASSDPSPKVQAMVHAPITGMTVEAQSDGKRYLYVQNQPSQGVTVIDITNPAQPKVTGFLNSAGQWTDSHTLGLTEGDPDAPQNHVEYGG